MVYGVCKFKGVIKVIKVDMCGGFVVISDYSGMVGFKVENLC